MTILTKIISSLCLAMLLLVIRPAGINAYDDLRGEYRVKAAFLYNFAKFVEWPQGAFSNGDAPIVFGVLGVDPFGNALDILAQKTVKGRTVLIRRFNGVQDIRVCHVLFISSSEKRHTAEIIAHLRNAGTLLVSDMKGFGRQGGMIQLITDRDRIGFEINISAARRAGLTLSSRLLGLARIVYGTSAGEKK